MAIQVNIHGGNGDKAIRELKRKMQRELVFRVMKSKRFYEPKSLIKMRERVEIKKRIRRNHRKRMLES
ncbi:MAG TPA: 30S ribosomal protein S21 [Candidatus Megaira endosymbiont of Hartmannula sinica]|nr:30S ribosomal protein S21 [Candidatus Megaera endosymbiont of Hartmannula sinica]